MYLFYQQFHHRNLYNREIKTLFTHVNAHKFLSPNIIKLTTDKNMLVQTNFLFYTISDPSRLLSYACMSVCVNTHILFGYSLISLIINITARFMMKEKCHTHLTKITQFFRALELKTEDSYDSIMKSTNPVSCLC
jgi:hypothetical protein